MANTEVNATPSSGANRPPSPSPSSAPAGSAGHAPARIEYVQPLPTPSGAFRAIANLNRGFEEQRRNLAALQEFNFFPEEDLIAWGNILGRLQAEASEQLLENLQERMMNNALYYDRLCLQRERDLEDPNEILLRADERKQELAKEQRRKEELERKEDE